MKLKNLTTLLTTALGSPVNQSMLAQSLGITRQTISNRVKNDSELTVSELAKIDKYFNVQEYEKNLYYCPGSCSFSQRLGTGSQICPREFQRTCSVDA